MRKPDPLHSKTILAVLLSISLLGSLQTVSAACETHSLHTATNGASKVSAIDKQGSGALDPALEAVKGQQRKRKAKRKNFTWTELHNMYPGSFYYGGSRKEKRVALTFDDVPDMKYTPQILDILSTYKVRATFFVMGTRAAKYPAVVSRIRREGHMIGNHSYSHPPFTRITKEQFKQQILKTDKILRPLVGYSPRFIRPPYGEITPAQVEWAQKNGYIIVNWDVDSEDWKGIGSKKIIGNVQRTLQPGSIILQHAGGSEDLSGTVKALPKIIEMLHSSGYEIVLLPDLLNRSVSRKIP